MEYKRVFQYVVCPGPVLSAQWKILRDDAGNRLSSRLLQGWTWTSTHCKEDTAKLEKGVNCYVPDDQ